MLCLNLGAGIAVGYFDFLVSILEKPQNSAATAAKAELDAIALVQIFKRRRRD